MKRLENVCSFRTWVVVFQRNFFYLHFPRKPTSAQAHSRIVSKQTRITYILYKTKLKTKLWPRFSLTVKENRLTLRPSKKKKQQQRQFLFPIECSLYKLLPSLWDKLELLRQTSVNETWHGDWWNTNLVYFDTCFFCYYQIDAPYDISQEDGWIKIVNRTPSLINAFQLFCDLTCLKALVFPYFHLHPLLWHTLLGSCRIFVAIFFNKNGRGVSASLCVCFFTWPHRKTTRMTSKSAWPADSRIPFPRKSSMTASP